MAPLVQQRSHWLFLAAFIAASCSSSKSATPSDRADAAVGDGDGDGHGDGDGNGQGDGDAQPQRDAGPGRIPGAACGYEGRGKVLEVASGIALCMPPTLCIPETCPPGLGECVDGECVYKAGYQGVSTVPEAWATQYCDLSSNGCNGVSQLEPPATTAMKVAASTGHPLCAGADASDTCVGIVASPPMMVGNSETAIDPSTGKPAALWGLGMTEATGLCYAITGPGGSALVAVTDRCGGYCRCAGGEYAECGACVNAADAQVKCPCVGAAPPLYDACCVRGEPVLCGPRPADDNLGQCDWCASNNHPHFDLDDATFAHVCGSEKDRGSCRLSKAQFVKCGEPDSRWPANR